MKYVAVSGGLGNQMFIYAFMLSLRNKGEKAVMVRLHSGKSYGYHRFELPYVFELLAEDKKESLASIMLRLCWRVFGFLPVQKRAKVLGLRNITVPSNFIYYPELKIGVNNNELLRGTWQSEKYFNEAKSEVLEAFKFQEKKLSEKTLQIKQMIEETNSVSIHIRRDDYLSQNFREGFGGICTLDYYKGAVQLLLESFEGLTFYVFSDDPQWAHDNLLMDNCVYVNHNSGNDSWQDMYLMHCCKHNIIANSTFSWWGAYLNPNPQKIVISPKVWWNGIEDDVVPSGWIRL